MAIVSKPFTFSAGAVIVAAEHNSNFDEIYDEINGKISDANVSATAAISITKISASSTDAFYFGNSTTDGTWKIYRSGDNLVFARRESSSWVDKGGFLA